MGSDVKYSKRSNAMRTFKLLFDVEIWKLLVTIARVI